VLLCTIVKNVLGEEPVLVPVWWVRANWRCCVLCRHCSSVQYAALRTTDDHDSAVLSDASSRNVGYTCYSVFKWDWNSTEVVYIGTYTRKCRGNWRLDPLLSPIWQQMESHSKIRYTVDTFNLGIWFFNFISLEQSWADTFFFYVHWYMGSGASILNSFRCLTLYVGKCVALGIQSVWLEEMLWDYIAWLNQCFCWKL